jgi:uncharacterized protein YecT (DUF1311 family)
MDMFWNCKSKRNVDGIQRLFELTEAKRCKDLWHLTVLHQDRLGNETWEVYCFTHGLPTRNPGTWLPQQNAPTCGDVLCIDLARRWDLLWKRQIPWSDMKDMECSLCKLERQRRCCIISQLEAEDKHRQGFFAEAPFVHPYRAPTNVAHRLRALRFARERQQPLLWVVAHDELVSKDKISSRTNLEQAQQNWLTYHDRWTAGIPGFMPLVLDMPVRFTCEPDRNDRLQGVFTNARGWLRGWELPKEEEDRLQSATTHEIALTQRPLRLYIETVSQSPKLELIDGRRIYVLRCHCKSWYKDGDSRQVEIKRFGFPVVPDFGGTAHAYCGTTLSACIGDLLEWHVKPQREAAIRGYTAKQV